jgi:potassium-transporting ATPase potassium-binding subunit
MAILSVMLAVLVMGVKIVYQSESAGNPQIRELSVDAAMTDQQSCGNMEGKEVWFGIARTALVVTATTATSTGASNGCRTPSHDRRPCHACDDATRRSDSGGAGSGLSVMVILVLIAVFITGLMVGRTPKYLGKKLEPYEIKMASMPSWSCRS